MHVNRGIREEALSNLMSLLSESRLVVLFSKLIGLLQLCVLIGCEKRCDGKYEGLVP